MDTVFYRRTRNNPDLVVTVPGEAYAVGRNVFLNTGSNNAQQKHWVVESVVEGGTNYVKTSTRNPEVEIDGMNHYENIRDVVDALDPNFFFETLTFSRLNEEGGVLHTGSGDGIIYAECAVGTITLPVKQDKEANFIASAPAIVKFLLAFIDSNGGIR